MSKTLEELLAVDPEIYKAVGILEPLGVLDDLRNKMAHDLHGFADMPIEDSLDDRDRDFYGDSDDEIFPDTAWRFKTKKRRAW